MIGIVDNGYHYSRRVAVEVVIVVHYVEISI